MYTVAKCQHQKHRPRAPCRYVRTLQLDHPLQQGCHRRAAREVAA